MDGFPVWWLVNLCDAAPKTSKLSIHAPFHDIPTPYTRVHELISDSTNLASFSTLYIL